MTDTVVIGLGDEVRSRDELGVHAVRRLRARHPVTHQVELVEGGDAGMRSAPSLGAARRAIFVDVIDIGAPAGSLVRLTGRDWPLVFAQHLTPHDVSLDDLLEAAMLTGAGPAEIVLHGVQRTEGTAGEDEGGLAADVLDGLVRAIAADLESWGLVPPLSESG